jgi:hypothetical protein
MALGDKLQTLASKLYTKFGTQQGTVVIRNTAKTKGSSGIAGPYASAINTDITLASGVSVSFANEYKVSSAGTVQVGDLLMTIPGDKVTAAQLKNAKIIYPFTNQAADPRYDVKSFRPSQILNGVVTVWRIVARRETS